MFTDSSEGPCEKDRGLSLQACSALAAAEREGRSDVDSTWAGRFPWACGVWVA